MSSKTDRVRMRSAAWRISLGATLAFAFGTSLVFAGLHRFVANDIQRRSDAWLSGEVEVLGDVAERTPKDSLYSRVVGEVAELASREVPNRQRSSDNENDAVFFLQAGDSGPAKLWVGSGDGAANLAAIRSTRVLPDVPFDVRVQGFGIPFRVASVRIEDGSNIYLGLSERDELHVLRNLLVRFLTLWVAIVLLGFVIVFYATRKMLGRVSEITEAASRIGQSDLSSRVPDTRGNDEIGHLARTLNHMLDRIENTVHQLHTITDSLAHDLRSPLTAISGRLETSLANDDRENHDESIVSAIDELDRLTEFLNTSLDVAEAKADALKLGYKLLQSHVLLLQLSHLPYLVHFQASVLRLPSVERLLANPSLPYDLSNRNSNMRLLQHSNHLLHTESLLLHAKSPFRFCRRLTFRLAQKYQGRSQCPR